MRVKALEKTYYDKRDRLPGEVYEMDDRESVQIKLLETLGKIEVVPVVSVKDAPTYKTAAFNPEPETPTTPTDAPEQRRRYRRRDMRAEE